MVISVVERMQERGTRSQGGVKAVILNRGVTEGLGVKVTCEQQLREDEGGHPAQVGEEMGSVGRAEGMESAKALWQKLAQCLRGTARGPCG